MQRRKCVYCNKLFVPKKAIHFFCSKPHSEFYNKSKDWRSYFKKLLNNNAKERKQLTVEDLLELYAKQNGRCALSGIRLTKIVGTGVVNSNASLDRIRPGGAYCRSNIRLVTGFCNSFRGNSTDAELIFFARRIVQHAKKL